jgi:Cu+-exporting ATPase
LRREDPTLFHRLAVKARIIEELQQAGRRVALIGNDVNDAPALAQANLGFTLRFGADIAMAALVRFIVEG